jgi:myosin heavy subunit
MKTGSQLKGKFTSRKIDLMTGKEVNLVYFDPSQALDCESKDSEWIGKNFYMPAEVIKEEKDCWVVRLPSGEVMKQSNVTSLPHGEENGVEDILKLKDFSEMSLTNALRVRYQRDEIYTFAGPILISINPYKEIPGLYATDTMLQYHGGDKVD